jgi:uncharacterized membrane protein
MRKQLEAIGLAGLALMVWITGQALYGPARLPDRIPTHFDAAGNPNGWGPAFSLLFLPLVAVVIYSLISVIARFPALFNYPVRVTEENRARLEALTIRMLVWLKVELVCLFAWIQWFIVRCARQAHGTLSPAVVVLFLIAVFGTVGWHILAIFRAVRPE